MAVAATVRMEVGLGSAVATEESIGCLLVKSSGSWRYAQSSQQSLGVLVDVMAVHGSTLAGELSHTGVERDDAVALSAQRGGPGKNRCG